MNEFNDLLIKNNIFLKKIEDITPKTRKQIKIYLGTDIDNFYYLIVKINKKSRFIMKDLNELNSFISTIVKIKNINFSYKKRVLILKGEICSKTKTQLKDWKIL